MAGGQGVFAVRGERHAPDAAGVAVERARLLDRLGPGKRPPDLAQFDAAAAAVADRIEDRILAGLASDPDQKP